MRRATGPSLLAWALAGRAARWSPGGGLDRAALTVLTAAILGACSATAPSDAPTTGPSPTPSSAPSPSPSPRGPGDLPHVTAEGICQSSGDYEVDSVIGGIDRYVLVHRPASAVAAKPAPSPPLVMALHGNGGSAADMGVLTGLSKAADATGFVVAYPQGEARAWGIEIAGSHFGRDRSLLDSTVGALGAGGCIDPSRVILVGFSLGGIIGDELACTDTERFHVIVEVSSRDVSEPCAPSGPVTFVAYSGMLDDILPYKGGRLFGWTFPPAEAWAAGWAAHNGCSVGPLTTESNDRLDRLDWSGCGAPTVFYRIKRGPHTWFGGDPPIGGIGLEDTDPVETVLRLVQGQAP